MQYNFFAILLKMRNNASMQQVASAREHVGASEYLSMEGEVEGCLDRLSDMVVMPLKLHLNDGVDTAVKLEADKPHHQWLFDYLAQVALLGAGGTLSAETAEEFEVVHEGAVKRYIGMCNARMACLVDLVLGKLAREKRVYIVSLMTLDVHARDAVQKLASDETEGHAAFLWQQQLCFFLWQKQLCFYWAQTNTGVNVRIFDFRRKYSYEWIGNTSRLVITPITDRSYITLAMGLRLLLGGNPAGPAGTDKTEAGKGLARAMACYDVNYLNPMKYQTMVYTF